MYDPRQGRWTAEDPIGFSAADMNLYRYVGNAPTNLMDPSGCDPDINLLIKKQQMEQLVAKKKKAIMEQAIEDFKKAIKKNKIDKDIGQAILDACLNTPRPFGMDPCEKWAKIVDGKLPERDEFDFVKGTVRLVPGPEAARVKGAKKVKAGLKALICSWTYTPCGENFWCILVSGHYAIKVVFPDGQVFYFDDGDWGRVFRKNNVPWYASGG
jgi:hypothetical protein